MWSASLLLSAKLLRARDKHNIKCRYQINFCWMKKQLQQKYPNLDKFLLCFPSTWNVPSTSFSPAQILQMPSQKFLWFFQPKETLHHPDDHSTLSGLFSKYYPSSGLLITEVALPETHIHAEGSRFLLIFEFLVTHRFIHLKSAEHGG